MFSAIMGINHHVLSMGLALVILNSCVDAVNLNQDVSSVVTQRREEHCSHTLTNNIGNFDVSVGQLGQGGSCMWFISVDNAISLQFLFKTFSPRSHENSNMAVPSVDVLIYDNDPGETNFPLEIWHGNENNVVKSFPGNTLWLEITLGTNHVSSDTDNAYWSIAYVANMDGSVLTCNDSTTEAPENGRVTVENNTFGSIAVLNCFDGYIAVDGPGYAVCSVADGSLSWVLEESTCETICKFPPQVAHSILHLSVDTFVSYSNRPHINSTDLALQTRTLPLRTTNSTVEYVCNEPYILEGKEKTQCGLDAAGVPRWFDLPPSCVIPDCSTRIILTQHSGALVNPPLPSTATPGQTVHCSWEITAPAGATISLYVRYFNFDLPSSADPQVVFMDVGAARPHQLLRLTNLSAEPENVTSDTSKVLVTYSGPYDDNVNDQRGLYVNYLMRSQASRLHQAAPIMDTNPSTPSSSSLPVSSSSAMPSAPSSLSVSSSTPPSSTTAPTSSTQTTSLSSSSSTTAPTSSTQTTSLSSSSSPTSMGTVTSSFSTSISVPSSVSTSQITTMTSQSASTSSASTAPSTVNNGGQSIEHSTSTMPTSLVTSTLMISAGSPTTLGQVNEESDDNWKIAVGFVVPVVILIAVLVGVYICYRKKYPVRMIIGREFGKFSNPHYVRPRQQPTLVRDDADQYFTNTTSPSLALDEMNPVNNKIHYDNLGYNKDEGDDEDEAERKFRERKSWLFKKTSQEPETTPKIDVEAAAGSSAAEEPKDRATSDSVSRSDTKRTESVDSTETDISEILGEQQTTPKPKRRFKRKGSGKKERRAGSSATGSVSSTEDVTDKKSTTSDVESEDQEDKLEYKADKKSASSVSKESIRDNIPSIILESLEGEAKSNYMKTAMMLFQQPTFEEVWAEVKSRSRTMSVDRPKPEVRPRSFSVDPSKSARKMSLHDDTLMSYQAGFLSVDKMKPLTRSQELPNLTASVVGVDIRERPQSFDSSDLTDEEEDVLEALPAEERERCYSLTSVNSNPHLVTDLDETLSEHQSVRSGRGGSGRGEIGDEDEEENDTKLNAHSKKISGEAKKLENDSKIIVKDEKSRDSHSRQTGKENRSGTDSSGQSTQSSHSSKGDQDHAALMLQEHSDNSKVSSAKASDLETIDKEEADDKDSQISSVEFQEEVSDLSSSYVSTTNIVLKTAKDKEGSVTQSQSSGTGEESEEQKYDERTDRAVSLSSQNDSDSDKGEHSGHDQSEPSSSIEPYQSTVQLSLATSSSSEEHSESEHTSDAGHNKIKVIQLGSRAPTDVADEDKSDESDIDDFSDEDAGHSDDNQNDDPETSGQRKLRFVLPPRDHTSSHSSVESVKGSSNASETDSSEDDDDNNRSYDFATGSGDRGDNQESDLSVTDDEQHEAQKEIIVHSPGDTSLTASAKTIDKNISGATEVRGVERTGSPSNATEGTSSTVSKRKIVSEIKLSDSSSDSSDVEPPGQIRFLSRQEESHAPGAEGENRHALRRIKISHKDDSRDISDEEEEDDDEVDNGYRVTDSDLSEILEESNEEDGDDGQDDRAVGGAGNFDFTNKATYTFRQENSEDEDIDV